MALLQLSNCRLLEPLIHRAIPDGLNVTLVLEVNVGEGRQKRLQETIEAPMMTDGAPFPVCTE